ncbi:MAG: ribosome hibernation-promoting factor, HPF/YfiA family [Bacilli bacterium]
MNYNIHATKLTVTDAIREYIIKRIGKLEKYFQNYEEININILIKTNGINQKIEVTIPIKKQILRAESNTKDLYTSIDLVVEKLERQIKKNKTRTHQQKNKELNMFADVELDEEKLEDIVKRKVIENKPMSEEEAILQMNLIGHNFYLFKDMESNSTKVLYKRDDENYGIIEMK